MGYAHLLEIYVCVYVCVCACVCLSVFVHVCLCVLVCACAYMYMRVSNLECWCTDPRKHASTFKPTITSRLLMIDIPSKIDVYGQTQSIRLILCARDKMHYEVSFFRSIGFKNDNKKSEKNGTKNMQFTSEQQKFIAESAPPPPQLG